jgi:hypothetical protein
MSTRLLFIFSVLITLACVSFAGKVWAAPGASCIPGLPCVTNLTPNDPATDPIEPNESGAPNADKSDIDSCDADFMNTVYARAFLEANREMMIGAYAIAKPDSVLEYSCFENEVSSVGSTAGPIFTESSRWAGTPVPQPHGGPIPLMVYMTSSSLDDSLSDLVEDSLSAFADNFPHRFAGGKQASPSKGCNRMMAVWEFSKCEDINDAQHFMTFEELVSTDPRNIPDNAGDCSDNPITTDLINVANNNAGQYAAKDPVPTHVEFVGGDTCADPIPTGVMVYQLEYDVDFVGSVSLDASSSTPFPDSICSTPGCYFDGAGGTCVGP